MRGNTACPLGASSLLRLDTHAAEKTELKSLKRLGRDPRISAAEGDAGGGAVSLSCNLGREQPDHLICGLVVSLQLTGTTSADSSQKQLGRHT